MMYPFLQLDDSTEIVHSEMLPNGEVKVYVEKPDAKDGFHHATCFLPGYRWEAVPGFTAAEGAPVANATKVWITKAGKCLLCNNNSQISERVLRNIMRIIEARSFEVIEKWTGFFGEASYFC